MSDKSQLMGSGQYPTDRCWETGVYTDDCECEFCSHKHYCSGYDHDEDDD